ncbi:MAG: tRNA uridine-5-carboxymethylaminomethyl(34) synthesis GTPase MnmE, partial [Bacteroidia bacterium]|nr:tRNA uridine-5-carboxymethylaminomethyl(34) synthesis GTPase MnmE [Bacteroidia bacterium]
MDTIFALSSASGQAGVAVIRLSGKQSLPILKKMTPLRRVKARYAYFSAILDKDKSKIDEAVVLYFKAPHSFTGEDVVEIQCHGSRAVVEKILTCLGSFPDCRMAEAGEFTRRAVYNGKMDLTVAEGLLDLIHAQTQAKRKWAVRQMGGALQKLYDGWREELVHALAFLEAYLDFPEEEIPSEHVKRVTQTVRTIAQQIQTHLNDNHRGRKLKEGFVVALVGAPNVGKSSLLNQLAQKDVAIVSNKAGTTRDIIEVSMDVCGYPVTFADTAGLRTTKGEIEGEGIRRAMEKIKQADLVLALAEAKNYPKLDTFTQSALAQNPNHWIVWNKCDLTNKKLSKGYPVCALTGKGIDALWAAVSDFIIYQMGDSNAMMITHERYRESLTECLDSLQRSLLAPALELQAED